MSALPQSKDASGIAVGRGAAGGAMSPRAAGRVLRLLVIAMLACLHVAAMVGVEDIWARGMMMAHLGLFLVWQPFMQGGQRLKVSVTHRAPASITLRASKNWSNSVLPSRSCG